MYIGLDIGGTKTIVCAADQNGEIISKRQEPTPFDLMEGLQLIHNLVSDILQKSKPTAIGAAIGGPLDWRSGVVSPLHQPSWRAVPLKQIFENKYQCPFYMDVDTNIAALGEYAQLTVKPQRLLYITISTGMGGGFLINGNIYRGAAENHPEIAHQSVSFKCLNPQGVRCECGAPDCLEALVSGNGIQRVYGKTAENLTQSEWEEVGYNLGQGLRNLAVLYAPDLITLGGGVIIGKGSWLIEFARKVMADHLYLVPDPKIRISKLGYYTALHGAVHAAINGIH